jgi:iron-sulfur cluster repair protein YtfE (RIC family)
MRHPSLISLSHDHHHGLALALRCRKQALGQIKPMGIAGLQERAKEFREFFTSNLIAHFRAEEEVLFPRIRSQVAACSPMLDELIREHEQIKKAIPQLDGETGLGKLIFDLGDLLERHIRKEEREIFPLFERHLPAIGADTVADAIEKILGHRPTR